MRNGFGYPVFNFQCDLCNVEFEESQSLEDNNNGHQILCPDCGGLCTRLFNAGIPTRHVSWSSWKVGLGQD